MATKQTIAELLVEIGVDAKDAEKAAARVSKRLDDVGKAGKKADKGVTGSEKALKRFSKAGDAAGKVAKRVGTLLAGVGAALTGLSREVLTVGTRFEQLRVQLKTATGSAVEADRAFRFIREFAKTTPFQVEEVTQAFVKLTNFGIEPTKRTLTAFGDFASAMGKDLDQFVEAVTDAVTGEFERLKEFGIRSSSEGDRVAFTFRGVTTEVGKNATEIQAFLTQLAENNFGGAMADQALTVGGTLSNLQDTWNEFLNTVANMGPLEEFRKLIGDLSEAAGGRRGLARQLAQVLTRAIRGVRRLLQGNLIPTLERVLSVIEFVINNFELLAGVFVAGKLVAGVASLTTAMGGLGLSITALTGPVGIAIAALGALGVAAVTVTRQIESIPEIPPPPGPVIDEATRRLAPETAPKIEAAQEELQTLRESIARNPALDIQANRERVATLERRIASLSKQAQQERSARAATSLEESLGALSGASDVRARQREVEEFLAFGRGDPRTGALPEDVLAEISAAKEAIAKGATVEEAIGVAGTEAARLAGAEGFGIVGRREGADAQRKRVARDRRKREREAERERKKREKERMRAQPTTVSEFFAAATRGELGPIAERTPSTRAIEPTVAVDITNNNFNFRDTFNITGAGSPVEAGKEVVRMIKAEFDMRLRSAGQRMPANMVR